MKKNNQAKVIELNPKLEGEKRLDIINKLSELLGAGKNYDIPRVTPDEIAYLRGLVNNRGIQGTAEMVNVSAATLMTVMAGFAHLLKPTTAQRVQKFLAKRRGGQ